MQPPAQRKLARRRPVGVWLRSAVGALGVLLAAVCLTAEPSAASAQESVAELRVLKGSATVIRGSREIEVRRGYVLLDTDRVRTGSDSKAQVSFYRPLTGSAAIVTAETEFEVRALSARKNPVLRLLFGAIRARLVAFSQRRPFMQSATATIGVKGTDFIVYVRRENADKATEFIGVEGLIEAASRSRPEYSIRIGRRQWGEIVAGEPPKPPIRVPDELWYPALREFSFPGETPPTAPGG